jgi:hypothetical protein
MKMSKSENSQGTRKPQAYAKLLQTNIRTNLGGSVPIDGIFVSVTLKECRCGYSNVDRDHVGMWLDIPYHEAWGQSQLAEQTSVLPGDQCLLLNERFL